LEEIRKDTFAGATKVDYLALPAIRTISADALAARNAGFEVLKKVRFLPSAEYLMELPEDLFSGTPEWRVAKRASDHFVWIRVHPNSNDGSGWAAFGDDLVLSR
jgi:hypothetical protein